MEFGPAANQMRKITKAVLKDLTNLLIILMKKQRNISMIGHLETPLITGRGIKMEARQTLNYMVDFVVSLGMLSLINPRIQANLK